MSPLPPDDPHAPDGEPRADRRGSDSDAAVPADPAVPAIASAAASDTGARAAGASADAETVLPGWEQWESSLEQIDGASRKGAEQATGPEAAPPPRPPFPTDEFGFLDLPQDFTLAAARGVADPAAWPTDEEWRRAADPTPSQGVAAVGDPASGSGAIEHSDAGALAWSRSGRAASTPPDGDHPSAAQARANAAGDAEPDARQHAAALLAGLAERVRAGQLDLRAVPGGANDAAVLAAVLTALLTDRPEVAGPRREDG